MADGPFSQALAQVRSSALGVKPPVQDAPLDPTTAGQPNSLAPAFKPSMPSVQDVQNDKPSVLGDLASGAAKGAADTGFNIQKGIAKTLGSHDPLYDMPNDQLGISPNSAAERAGAGMEHIAEYAVPGAAVDKALVQGGATMLPRMLAGATTNAGVAAAQGERDPARLATDAAMGTTGPIAEAAGKAAMPVVRNVLLGHGGFLRNTAEAPGVVDAADKLGFAFTKKGLADKAVTAAGEAGNDAKSALSNYSGPNFDARPGLQMISDARDAAAAEGKPEEYIKALNALEDAIKNRASIGPDRLPVTSRTNPANLGMKKFQDTIERVSNNGQPADMADNVANTLSGQLKSKVPGYGDALNQQGTMNTVADQLTNVPQRTLLEKLMDMGKTVATRGGAGGLAGAVVGRALGFDPETSALVGAGLGTGAGKLYGSALFRTGMNEGFKGLAKAAPSAARGAAAMQTYKNTNTP